MAEAEELRGVWLAAEKAVATGQTYTIGNRSLTRADARFIHEQFMKYDKMVAGLKSGRGGGVRVMRIMPRDL